MTLSLLILMKQNRRKNRYWDFNHSQGDVEEYQPTIGAESNTLFAVEATRTLTNKKGSKKLYFHEMPKNKEFPHTLDLRQRWIKH